MPNIENACVLMNDFTNQDLVTTAYTNKEIYVTRKVIQSAANEEYFVFSTQLY